MDKRTEKNRDKWLELKRTCLRCPNCHNERVGLNEVLSTFFHRFFVECEECHWCGKSRPTIKWAIKVWNKEKR